MRNLMSFNKSSTAFVTATPHRTGYKYFGFRGTNYPDYQNELVRYHRLPVGRILVLGDLMDNSIGAMVLDSHPKQVHLIDYAKNFEEKVFHYRDDVMRVKMFFSDLLVFHYNRITVHDYGENGFFVKTPSNPKSIGDFVRTKKMSRFAYPDGKGPNGKYSIMITNAVTRENIVRIGVHEQPIGAIAFSPTGVKIAISGENGKECYILESDTGIALYKCCLDAASLVISSIMFNKSDNYLVSSFQNGMVYIFQLNDKPSETKAPYKIITLPENKSGVGSICGLVAIGDGIRLMVAFEHYLYVHYLPNFISEGEGKLFDLKKINDKQLVEFSPSLSEDTDGSSTSTAVAATSDTASAVAAAPASEAASAVAAAPSSEAAPAAASAAPR